jgi:hypothetical protein
VQQAPLPQSIQQANDGKTLSNEEVFKKNGTALKIIRTANALEGYKRVTDFHKSFYQ